MADVKQLKPEEYSETRKEAEKEKEQDKEKRKQMEETNMTAKKNTTAKTTPKKEGFGKTKYCKCSACGKDKFVREDIYQNRIKKFGSEEKLKKSYVCRECRKKTKDSKKE
jgi:molecular chaperone DnaK (HSP70)